MPSGRKSTASISWTSGCSFALSTSRATSSTRPRGTRHAVSSTRAVVTAGSTEPTSTQSACVAAPTSLYSSCVSATPSVTCEMIAACTSGAGTSV